MTMENFNVPTKAEVSSANQEIFDNLERMVGFVPNLYAAMAHSDTALGNYLQFQNAKTSLSNKEKEVVNLIVSQINGCKYCQSAHTAIAKMNGFTEEQVLELRGGSASWDTKTDALVKIAGEITERKGRINEITLKSFYEQGYDKGNLVDIILQVGDKTVMNYLHNLTQIPVDFPLAEELESVSH